MSYLSRDELISLAKKNDIALVYSRSELHEYLVELISSNEAHYIHRSKDVSLFHSIDEALRAAQNHGATDFYLCIENTYDEFGPMNAEPHFSYVPIQPKH